MAEFFVTRNETEDKTHQIHSKTCDHLPEESALMYIGAYARKEAAEADATFYYKSVSYCPKCLA